SFQTTYGIAGTAHVTLTVTDADGGQTNRNFTIVSDSLPSIGFIPDQLTQRNVAKGPVSFSVYDNETGPNSVTLSAQSLNTTLLPVSNISFGGSGASRTITMTPATNQYGTVFITVLASDGMLTNSTSFRLTVNNPPNLDWNNPLVLPQGGTATITSSLLQASDADGSAGGTIFTLNPDGSGGPPHNGTVLK